MRFITTLFVLLYAMMLGGGELTKVTFCPQWYPQAQFAGYYVAKKSGLYAKYGLEVDIKFNPPQRSVVESLPQGKADFASDFLATGLTLRSKGLKIVNICQLSQQSALAIAVEKEKSGIKKLSDLEGRRIAIFPSYFKMEPESFLKLKGIKADLVPVASGIELYIWNGVDALTVMYYNEYNMMIESGINKKDIKLFYLKDNGYNIPEDGIYCSERMLKEKPEVCRRFVLATLEGWKEAFTHKEKTLKIVKQYMDMEHLPYSETHQMWMLNAMEKLFKKPSGQQQRLTADQCDLTFNLLNKGGFIEKKPDFSKFYQPVVKEYNLTEDK